ncbi:D-aminoacyl-tRNA deacylase [Thermodesulfobacterium hydrogeniphilum]|uniref:D-aminoacyl-tRNA deacylase n=1 Tax=Thermodesulfobacterium hydrogeniphilum TaxID=161156 RepID=UPI00056E4DA1|nr:D-aminoacyl-tRNA deacylase [Thermodesulfobacterium hydrogeniphilum]
MKIVIQRVKKASVWVEDKLISQINCGLLVLVCCEKEDNEKTLDWIADKLVKLRIFSDESGKFNLSVRDIKGEILLVSNFTVCGYLKKGTRPTFHLAEEPEKAKELLQTLAEKIKEKGISVKEGIFGAHMEIHLVNDGPVTLYLEYLKKI